MSLLLLVGALSPCAKAVAQRSVVPSVTQTFFEAMRWRGIGPSFGARVADLAIPDVPHQPWHRLMYVSFATGGIWKSENGGISWASIFDGERTNAIFSIAVAKTNPSIIWVSTGDLFAHWSASFAMPGRGIFKSLDGGKTWSNMGFTNSAFLGRVVIDPTNPDVVYVGVLGPIRRASQMRGLYKTTDGGRTWKHIHFVNERTGTVDVAVDPVNPQILYTADIQLASGTTQDDSGTFVHFGPGSGIYKTTDGGTHWMQLTSGLPTGSLGRIGIAVSPSRPSTVYALVEVPHRSRGPGSHLNAVLYRSDDAGSTWTRRRSIPWGSGYWDRVYIDPYDDQRIYLLQGETIQESEDGGKTTTELSDIQGQPIDGDGHAIWIDPTDTDHLIFGNDRGLWYSWDRGKTSLHLNNIPTSSITGIALTRVALRHAPSTYHIVASLQDHDTYVAPSNSGNAIGIVSSDWDITNLGEDFQPVINPRDSDWVYVEGEGAIVSYNLNTWDREGSSPLPGFLQKYGRQNSALNFSPFDSQTLYIGVSQLYKSVDRGRTWFPISGHFQDHITAMAESPRRRGYLFVGMASGAMAYSPDGGKHWKVGTEAPGVPPGVAVTRIVASRFATRSAYATLAAEGTGDFHPYVVRTEDGGKHWRQITSNLPSYARTWTAVEDPRRQGMLFLATNDGIFFTTDDGRDWKSLQGNMPPVAVTDIALQPDFDDLVAASLGRGVYVLDDVRSLETLDTVMRQGRAHIFPIQATTRMENKNAFGVVTPPAFAGPNPMSGVLITYYMPSGQRDAQTLTISDDSGRTLQNVPIHPGFHRVAWDMRAGALRAIIEESPGYTICRDASAPSSQCRRGPSSKFFFTPVVPPGQYVVAFQAEGRASGSNGVHFTVVADPRSVRSQASYDTVWSQELDLLRFLWKVNATLSTAERLKQQFLRAYALDVHNQREHLAQAEATANSIVFQMQNVRSRIATISFKLDSFFSEPLRPRDLQELRMQRVHWLTQLQKVDALCKTAEHM